jgi:hypothetical protein
MNTFIDRDAGFAAFRQGRSLCLRLDGDLDTATAIAIGRRLHDDAHATRLRLECSTLERADVRAGRILARALLGWAQQRDDRSIEVHNLDPTIRRAVAWHPLRAVTEPDAVLFFDPDRDPDWVI